jgi:hypothetical protein
MDEADKEKIASLHKRLAIIRDHVRGVALKRYSGLYLYGRPGTSKTYCVRTSLDAIDADYHYLNGSISTAALFGELAAHDDKIIVLDDVGALFHDRTAQQILLAALGKQPGDGPRIIIYVRHGKEMTVEFSGGIIAISNERLGRGPLHRAIASRVPCLHYDPPDDETAVLMRSMAACGWPLEGERVLTPDETLAVTEYVIEMSAQIGCRLDMRVLFDMALPYYHQYKCGQTESDWRDLVSASLSEVIPDPVYSTTSTSAERREQEIRIAEEIRAGGGTSDEQEQEWQERTGRSRATYYRRKMEDRIASIYNATENRNGRSAGGSGG